MNIEFGAGETPAYPDYKKCDVRDVDGIDYVCNAWDIDQHVEPDTVEHIFSRHFFEHLTFAQGKVFVDACHKILKDGGCYEMVLPNFRWHVRQWLTEDNVMGFNIDNPFQRGMDGLWGKQRGTVEEVWDVHKSGYKQWQLVELFQKAGYTEVEFIDCSVKEIHMKAYK
jgi:predicted SAM-dependent methyltransferase